MLTLDDEIKLSETQYIQEKNLNEQNFDEEKKENEIFPTAPSINLSANQLDESQNIFHGAAITQTQIIPDPLVKPESNPMSSNNLPNNSFQNNGLSQINQSSIITPKFVGSTQIISQSNNQINNDLNQSKNLPPENNLESKQSEFIESQNIYNQKQSEYISSHNKYNSNQKQSEYIESHNIYNSNQNKQGNIESPNIYNSNQKKPDVIESQGIAEPIEKFIVPKPSDIPINKNPEFIPNTNLSNQNNKSENQIGLMENEQEKENKNVENEFDKIKISKTKYLSNEELSYINNNNNNVENNNNEINKLESIQNIQPLNQVEENENIFTTNYIENENVVTNDNNKLVNPSILDNEFVKLSKTMYVKEDDNSENKNEKNIKNKRILNEHYVKILKIEDEEDGHCCPDFVSKFLKKIFG